MKKAVLFTVSIFVILFSLSSESMSQETTNPCENLKEIITNSYMIGYKNENEFTCSSLGVNIYKTVYTETEDKQSAYNFAKLVYLSCLTGVVDSQRGENHLNEILEESDKICRNNNK